MPPINSNMALNYCILDLGAAVIVLNELENLKMENQQDGCDWGSNTEPWDLQLTSSKWESLICRA
jgi:hypothetical protein